MILDDCSTSTAIYIEGTEKDFTNISCNDFPDENISDLDTNALRRFKVMHSEYALPINLAQLFIWKYEILSVIFSIEIFLITLPVSIKRKPIIISETLI